MPSVEKGMCECLENIKSYKKIGYSDLQNCVKNAIITQKDKIAEVITLQYGDTLSNNELYNKSFEYGQKIGRELDTSMVYKCDTYFITTDSLRFDYLNKFDKDSINIEIEKLKSYDTVLEKDYLERKAQLFFFSGKYKEALSIANSLLEKNSENAWALIIKATSLEIDKKYNEAIPIYYKLVKVTGQPNYLVWAVCAKRKASLNK